MKGNGDGEHREEQGQRDSCRSLGRKEFGLAVAYAFEALLEIIGDEILIFGMITTTLLNTIQPQHCG